VGYLLDVELFDDPHNFLYLRMTNPLDRSGTGVSFEACLYQNYFLSEQGGKFFLRKLVPSAEGDNQVSSINDKAWLESASFQTMVDLYETGALTLWHGSGEHAKVMVETTEKKLAVTGFKETSAFERSATWKPTITLMSEMECPPASYKLELYKDRLPTPEEEKENFEPLRMKCSMSVDVDSEELTSAGVFDKWAAREKAVVDVHKDGNYRVSAIKEPVLQVKLDKADVINDQAAGLTERAWIDTEPIFMKKGTHSLEMDMTGVDTQTGFALVWQRVCPEKEVVSGGVSVTFPIAVAGSGEEKHDCPPSHNGRLKVHCDADAEEFSEADGECVVKKCAEVEVPSGSATLTFPETIQGAGEVFVQCPPTHNGRLAQTCAEEEEVWSIPGGECVEKACPADEYQSGGTKVPFLEAPQATGVVAVPCPATHKGTITRTCAAEQEVWSNEEGECVEKVCAETTVQSGGLEITFQERKQGFGLEEISCPETHHGVLKMTCAPETDEWSSLSGECVEKTCPGESVPSGKTHVVFPKVVQGTGDVTIQCPKNFAGEITRMCAPNEDKWSPAGGEPGTCIPTRPHFLVKSGHRCDVGGTQLGLVGTADECAVETEAVGAKFFVYRKETKVCESQKTISSRCPEGFVAEAGADFYSLSPAGFLSAAGAKCGTGNGELVENRAQCTQKCADEKLCAGAAYYRPPGCKEKQTSECERRCWIMADCEASTCPVEEGYTTYSKTKCPKTTLTSGTAKVKFDAVFSDTGEVTKQCPQTHNGEMSMDCVKNAVVWGEPSGECVEKQCLAKKITNGGAEVAFATTLQGRPPVTVHCPPSHTGAVTMQCPSKQEQWAQPTGSCQEKYCPNTVQHFAAGQVTFARTKQGTGEVSVTCPSTHTGTMKSTCAQNSNAWTPFKGGCTQKMCPRKSVDLGIVFNAVPQGRGTVSMSCPSGYIGTISMVCQGSANQWSSKSGSCQKACPRLSGGDHQANWWGSFDYTGWSLANGPITGFYRTSDQWLWNIEVASFRHYDRTQGITCTNANWWSSFDRKGWSTCPTGYYIHGLYRTGRIGSWSNNQLYHIEESHCCRPKESTSYENCVDANWWSSFDHQGWSSCPGGYAMTGIYRNDCNAIYCIESVRCCRPSVNACSVR
jgi:hypothetical protein